MQHSGELAKGYLLHAVGFDRDFITDQPVFFAQQQTPFLISAYTPNEQTNFNKKRAYHNSLQQSKSRKSNSIVADDLMIDQPGAPSIM